MQTYDIRENFLHILKCESGKTNKPRQRFTEDIKKVNGQLFFNKVEVMIF